jgi:8-oxo-dGTP diphosphatase
LKGRESIAVALQAISPLDALEADHQADALCWLQTANSIYRNESPLKHLVSYFLPVDSAKRSLLLVDHIKAGLWLPPGGHVEVDEEPWETVCREVVEELGVEAKHHGRFGSSPLFVTVTRTTTGTHEDVSLWFVLSGSTDDEFRWDPREFVGCKWMSFEEVLAVDLSALDPHMHRFVRKLDAAIR